MKFLSGQAKPDNAVSEERRLFQLFEVTIEQTNRIMETQRSTVFLLPFPF
jgi:hypothetical protein